MKRIYKNIRVSDHAIVRYLERVGGVNIEAIKRMILTEAVEDAVQMGAREVNTKQFTVKADRGVIVTIQPPKK